ncbi:hypothetical protein LX99_04782 [Mucilaginibacter oryzae]|uniref:Uncharacterized protein n=1 Tax=Mucilaginibacter oryzae TaxID=468058 RepID=A0A316GZA3_9SPHI|nr:hypothetical protein [Mucilaginibacter oryzae]PWK69283.1 hypothetical protein LX99_04782 [Mucilaginibacter oryzae]
MTLIFNSDEPEGSRNDGDTIPTIGKVAVAICPKCNSKFCDRIKRGRVVKYLLPWLKLKRYYCSKCQNRFYKRS